MTLDELIAALKAAEGPKLSDQLLCLVLCVIHKWPTARAFIATGDDGSPEYQVIDAGGRVLFSEYRSRCPDVSLDACAALQAKMLPGWTWVVTGGEKSNQTIIDHPTEEHATAALHKHPCISWLIAILRAVKAQKEECA